MHCKKQTNLNPYNWKGEKGMTDQSAINKMNTSYRFISVSVTMTDFCGQLQGIQTHSCIPAIFIVASWYLENDAPSSPGNNWNILNVLGEKKNKPYCINKWK